MRVCRGWVAAAATRTVRGAGSSETGGFGAAAGTFESSTETRQPPDARQSSAKWPKNPKPVTSVHATQPCSLNTAAAGPLDRHMPSSAPRTSLAVASARMSPAKTAPVPNGFVRTSASPSWSPPFVR